MGELRSHPYNLNSSPRARIRSANACQRCKAKKLKCATGESSTCSQCLRASTDCIFDSTEPKHVRLARQVEEMQAQIARLERELQDARENNQLPSPKTFKPQLFQPLKIGSSLEASGFSRLMKSVIKSAAPRQTPTSLANIVQPSRDPDALPLINPHPQLPDVAASHGLVTIVYRHVQARYPFMDWDQLFAWHAKRLSICYVDPEPHGDEQIGAYFIWLTYALAAQLSSAPDNPETYHARAITYLDAVMFADDFTKLRGLLFLLLYSFRSASGSPLWLLSGLIMRLALEIFLHIPSLDPEAESRKRIFWSAYSFDRLISLASSRPFSIADADIEVGLPLDVNPTGEPTSMSSALHTIRHYILRSRIHTTIYTTGSASPTREVVTPFLAELEEWRRTIPRTHLPSQGEDKFQMMYFQAVLLTLRPAIVHVGATDPLYMLCATAAAEACELGRKVHERVGARHTVVSLYHIFVCGLTLLHCVGMSPHAISQRVSMRAVRSCSSTLAIYAQLFPAAVPFRELFEHLADEVTGEPRLHLGPRQHLHKVIAEVLVGRYDQLAELYTSFCQPTSITQEAITDPVVLALLTAENSVASSAVEDKQQVLQDEAAGLPFDFAVLHKFSDLAGILDVPLNEGLDAQTDWASSDFWSGLQ